MATTGQSGSYGGQPDRTSVTVGGNLDGIYIPVAKVSADNTAKPTAISRLASSPGVTTEWDVTSLDAAITWLTEQADYLKRMYHGMDDLKSLMDGPQLSGDVMRHSGVSGQGGGPLGGFPWAVKLANRHSSLFQSFNTNLKTVVNNLYGAADALRTVKEKYGDVEHANAMSAAEMEADFTGAQSRVQSHNV